MLADGHRSVGVRVPAAWCASWCCPWPPSSSASQTCAPLFKCPHLGSRISALISGSQMAYRNHTALNLPLYTSEQPACSLKAPCAVVWACVVVAFFPPKE